MEQILMRGGQFGRFHARVCLAPMLISFLSAFHTIAPVYVLHDPPHRCRLPQESLWQFNDSFAAQSEDHSASVLEFIPQLAGNSSRLSRCHVRLNSSEQPCTAWVFATDEFHSTLVTELGLVCRRSHWATFISTCSFAGILVGIVLSGYLADWLGRRVSLLTMLWVLIAAYVASLFSVSVAFTAAVRFLIGVGALSTATVAYVMMLEFVGPGARHHLASVFGYSWSVGTAAVALTAYLTRSWRSFAIASLVPTAAMLALAHAPCLVPESPRWLMSRGRVDAAAAVVRRMLADNGVGQEEADTAVEELLALREVEKKGAPSVRRSVLQLVRSPRLLARYGLLCACWFVVAAVYFGLSMGAKNLPGSIFVTSCLIGFVDFPSYVIMHVAADRLGRKATFIGALVGSGLALVGLAASSHMAKEHTYLIIAFSLIGKMLNSCGLGIIAIWTGEMYPTNIRSAGLSTSSMFARFGTLFAPLLGNIRDFIPGEFGPIVSYVIFAVASFVSAGVAAALPETRGLTIPDSVADLLNNNLRPSGKSPPADNDADIQLLSLRVEVA